MTTDHINLTVAEGVHNGARVSFGLGSVISLGRDLENDISLSDLPDTGRAEHLRLSFREANRVDIFATGGAVDVGDHTIARDEAVSAPLPCSLRINSVKVDLSFSEVASRKPNAHRTAPKGRSVFSQKQVFRATISAAVIAVAMLSFDQVSAYSNGPDKAALNDAPAQRLSLEHSITAPDTTDDRPTLWNAQATPLRLASLAGDEAAFKVAVPKRSPSLDNRQHLQMSKAEGFADVTPTKPAASAQGVAFLRNRLAGTALDDITFSSSGNVITARGALAEDAKAAWQDLAEDLDFRFNSQFILVTDFTEKVRSQEMPERPSAVSFSQPPYLVGRVGLHLREGDMTEDGWTIVSIERQGIKLSQNDRDVLIPLNLDGVN